MNVAGLLAAIVLSFSPPVPEQVHLSVNSSAAHASLVVTWVTKNSSNTSFVKYVETGSSSGWESVTAIQSLYNLTGPVATAYTRYMHRAVLPPLTAGTSYDYKVGSDSAGSGAGPGWSALKHFFGPLQPGDRTPVHILAFADLSAAENDGGFGGVPREMAREVTEHDHARSMAAPSEGAAGAAGAGAGARYAEDHDAHWHYDILLHAGDLAYDLHQNGGQVGDAFMRDVEPIASSTPFMVAPGNHEAFENFSHFKHRFTMPATTTVPAAATAAEGGPQADGTSDGTSTGGSQVDSENLWWSVDVGMVHVISYNTEAYFDGDINSTVEAQYSWMKRDLEAAQANRDAVPWIIAQGHRPFYCNVAAHNKTTDTFACDGEQEQSRIGPASQGGKYAVEDLFYAYGVDLALYGHVHDYSRFLPTYNHTPMPGPDKSAPFTNPAATTYLTIGGAGNPEMPQPPRNKCNTWDIGCSDIHTWSPWAVCESGYYPKCPNFNYGRAVVLNTSHMYWEQVSVTKPGTTDGNGTVVVNASIVPGWTMDKFWLVQHHHGPFKPTHR